MRLSHVRTFFSIILPIVAAWSVAHAGEPKNDGGRQKHIFMGPAPTHAFDIILARPTDTSITASVLAYDDMDAFISFGTDKEKLAAKTDVKSLKPETPTEFVLKDLKPDTQYYYMLHTKHAKSAAFVAGNENTFHTQRKPGGSFVFTVQSDSHLDQSTKADVLEKTLANVLSGQPDFHIDLGDTFMNDKYPNYKESYQQYIAQRYYLGLVGHSAPIFMVLGNHDGERLDRFNSTLDCMPVWSCLNRKKFFPNPYPDSFYTGNKSEIKPVGRLESYYAFEWGDAQIIVLDPFWWTNKRGGNKGDNWTSTLGQEQYQWLEKTLAASKAKFKFVFLHHLVGGLDESQRGGAEAAVLYEWGGKGKTGVDEFKTKRPGWEMPIHQLLLKHKVNVVFHGHDHFFAKQDLDGITYLMVPQPGHPGFDRLRNADEYGYKTGDFLPPSGHIRVTVSGDKTLVEYIKASKIAYSFSIPK
ncbi:MAG: metallophosphoesterase [Planctomycetota bacterium]